MDQITAAHRALKMSSPSGLSSVAHLWHLRESHKGTPITSVRNQDCSGITCLRLCRSSLEIYPLPRNPLRMAVAARLFPTPVLFCLCVHVC